MSLVLHYITTGPGEATRIWRGKDYCLGKQKSEQILCFQKNIGWSSAHPAPPCPTGPVLLSECELKLNSCGTHYVTDSRRQLQMTAIVCFKFMSHLLKFLFDD